MVKDWIKELVLGIVFLVVGGVMGYYFLEDVIRVVKGAFSIFFVFLGVLFLFIGIEDKKLEKELEELEKELEEEIKEEDEKKEEGSG